MEALRFGVVFAVCLLGFVAAVYFIHKGELNKK